MRERCMCSTYHRMQGRGTRVTPIIGRGGGVHVLYLSPDAGEGYTCSTCHRMQGRDTRVIPIIGHGDAGRVCGEMRGRGHGRGVV